MAASGLRVWVTRAAPGAQATATRLRALGHAPLVASLLAVHDLDPDGLDLSEALPADGALAFTSANAVRAFVARVSRRDARVWAVGAASAAAARAARFTDVRSANGDVRALAAAIAADPPAGAVLHPCAREPAGDLAGWLAEAGVAARSLPIYETRAVEVLPEPALRALAEGALDAVLLHSPRAAMALARVAGANFERLAAVTAVGLSPACLAPLTALPFKACRAAQTPDEDALMRALA